jgi:hypothetical protein
MNFPGPSRVRSTCDQPIPTDYFSARPSAKQGIEKPCLFMAETRDHEIGRTRKHCVHYRKSSLLRVSTLVAFSLARHAYVLTNSEACRANCSQNARVGAANTSRHPWLPPIEQRFDPTSDHRIVSRRVDNATFISGKSEVKGDTIAA